jgi:spermidine synthase
VDNIAHYGLQDYVKVDYGDFFKFCDDPSKEFDLLYFDIDNDGDKVLEMYNGCKSNIEKGSVVIFEGGSQVRDDVEWMNNLNKVKITDIKEQVGYQLLTPNQKYSCSIIFNTKKYSL